LPSEGNEDNGMIPKEDEPNICCDIVTNVKWNKTYSCEMFV